MTTARIAATLAVAVALTLTAGAAPAAAFPSDARSCGALAPDGFPGVYANRVTTCQFAKATARKYLDVAPTVEVEPDMYLPAARTVRVYSKASRRTIAMRCRFVIPADSPYGLCTGGRGARVMLTS